ncbi:MAG: ABC transporter ATP-binding protein [Anaerolineales bacterium]|nr:ABC transporter ATP-binding protein [Anaerolineales bacterium]
MDGNLLTVENLSARYAARAGEVSAVDGVSFALARGEVLGLAGESGCGKTTLALSLLKLLPENGRITGGRILLEGTDLVPLSEDAIRPFRWRRLSVIFQGAMNSLHPVYRIADQIREALEACDPNMSRQQADDRISELFRLVGLDPALAGRYPHEYSGGMRQRAVIALALACRPDLVIADEPTTALDVIVQDSILREMQTLQRRFGMSMIYISHDIAVLAEISRRIAVMYAGRLAELGAAVDVFDNPLHPYTAALLASVPSLHGPRTRLVNLPGEPPDLLNPPSGCRFHPRCPRARDVCAEREPAWEDFGGGHFAACWNPAGRDA